MTYLGFFDVTSFAPLPVDLIVTDEMRAAILEAGEWMRTSFRDPDDHRLVAHSMRVWGDTVEHIIWYPYRWVEEELRRHSEEEQEAAIFAVLSHGR